MNRVRVLVADDNKMVLERVITLLAVFFEVVGTACTGKELVSQTLLLNPDVVVADITMPGGNGIEAVHQLKEAGSTARFVFLTIHSESEYLQACLDEGALGYVLKSRMRTDLVQAIKAAIFDKSFISPVLTR